MKHLIIFLNGMSSSGKTSLTKELLKKLDSKWLLLKVDDFLSQNRTVDEFNEYLGQVSKSSNIIVDHVLEKEEWYSNCSRNLRNCCVYWVYVTCSYPELIKREAERGDRRIGLVKEQIKLFSKFKYQSNLVIDTTNTTVAKCADMLIRSWRTYSKSSHNTQSDSALTTN